MGMEKSPDAFRTISEVAEALDIPAHVLRFWETRFPQIRPVKRAGGRRYYRPSDVALLAGIRFLLHDQGVTIRGVQKLLRERGIRHVAELGAGSAGAGAADATAPADLPHGSGAKPQMTAPVAQAGDVGPSHPDRVDLPDALPSAPQGPAGQPAMQEQLPLARETPPVGAVEVSAEPDDASERRSFPVAVRLRRMRAAGARLPPHSAALRDRLAALRDRMRASVSGRRG
ncbi:MAG: MerR family transcriptional regulator [Gemmobacter sp.]